MSEGAAPARRKKKHSWPWILLIVLLAVGGALFYRQRQSQALQQKIASVASYTAASGSITSTVVGTGNLSYCDAEDVTAPVGITADTVYAEPGDLVAQGDVLASLDPLSVEQAIQDAQARVDGLAQQLYDADAYGADTVASPAGGRVKAIYAEEGDAVSDVMAQHGALMVLSMDGKMAVDLPAWDGAKVGDDVTVTLSSGTEKDGVVAAVGAGAATVTISDNGPADGDAVTVSQDGEQRGTGTLTVHHPVEITGTEGVIDQVNVSENDWVDAGDEVFDLRELPADASYRRLRSDLNDWEAALVRLLALRDGYALTAPFDGAVASAALTDGQTVAGDGATAAVFTVSPTEDLLLDVSIDELDVSNVAAGQSVSVAVDALAQESFDGVITDVSDTGVTAGGSASYTAQITVSRSPDMRAGMTATATIVTDSKDGIVVIPAEAIGEDGNEEYVYTAVDQKTGALTGRQTVVSGLSDGTYTEIAEGLAAGDTIYYEPAGAADTFSTMMSFWQNQGDESHDTP